MEHYHPVLLPSECRVKQFPGEHSAGIRKNDEGDAEFAPLRLVNRQRVGELERGTSLVIRELALEIFDADSLVSDELDDQLLWDELLAIRLVIPNNDSDVP